ncbi:MAG: hypothetical protein ACO1OO_07490 [Flavisolibacter sp.]
MNLTSIITNKFLRRKIATVVLVSASVAAFAALGDGGGKKKATKATAVVYNYSKTFSLHSGYNYKSDDFLAAPESRKFIMLNTVVTYQKGNTTYIMPLKKKVFLEKINFNPAPKRF